MKHLQYLNYVLRHKWFVFVQCCHYGIIWRGVTHDLSKLLPSEWFPYAEHFYGKPQPGAEVTLEGKETFHIPGSDDRFDQAWLFHQHRNPHHWQYWILQNDEDGRKTLPMPIACVREMVADWRGAGMAQGHDDIMSWWTKNKDKMLLHPETQKQVEDLIGYWNCTD